MKNKFIISTRLFIALSFLAMPIAFVGCHAPALEAGGVYSDPVLANTDSAILTADTALTGFQNWVSANSAFLAQFPEVGVLAKTIGDQKNNWIKDAYAARDSYASASLVYKQAIATGQQNAVPPTAEKINAALAVLNNIVAQATAYRAAHPNV